MNNLIRQISEYDKSELEKEESKDPSNYYITLGQFREMTKDLDDSLPIILEKDAEGNGYSPLSSIDIGYYDPESTWSGRYFSEEDKKNMEYDKEYIEEEYEINIDSLQKVIVFHPIN